MYMNTLITKKSLLIFKHKALLHDSATIPTCLQRLSVLRDKYRAFLYRSLTIWGKMSIRY